MAGEKPHPGSSPQRKPKKADIARAVLWGVALGLLVLMSIPCVHESYYWSMRAWRHSRMDIIRLVALVELIKEVEQVDRDKDGRFEYVGWPDYVETLRAADPERIRFIEERLESSARSDIAPGPVQLSDMDPEALRRKFILNEPTEIVGEYQVQRGEYVGVGIGPRYHLALFTPRDVDNAERIWLLVAWTEEKRWFQRVPSFALIRNGEHLQFYSGKKFPMDSLRGLPDIDRLGYFEEHYSDGEIWRPHPLPE